MPTSDHDDIRRMFDEVSRQFEQVDRMFEGLFREGRPIAPGTTVYGPYYYGYSMTIGPDGKPIVKEYGNFRPQITNQSSQSSQSSQLALGTREPLVDTVLDQKKGVVRIAAEMPGVAKDDIKVSATEKSVTILAESGDKKYHSEVPLPAEIAPNSTQASYNNGILELTMKLKGQVKQKSTDVRVK